MKVKMKHHMHLPQKYEISVFPPDQDKRRQPLNYLIDNKLNNFIHSSKIQEKYRNTCLVQNLELLQSVPYSSFKKYQLQSTPRKSARKQDKNVAGQVQRGHETQLKAAHTNRIQQLKNKFHKKKQDGVDEGHLESKFNRTKSLLSQQTTRNQYLGMRNQTHKTLETIRVPNNKTFSNPLASITKQPTSIAANNAYMRRLKTKIQFYSLSTILTDKNEALFKHFSPKITSSMDQKSATLNPPQKPSKRNSLTNARTWAKKSKSTKFKHKTKFNSIQVDECRPWSSFKGDINNDFSSFL